MATVIVSHRVQDFAAWKRVYDSVVELRKGNGELSDRLYRDPSNPNELTVVFDWDSLDNARAYFAKPELKAAMAEAGVVGPPEVRFLESL